jgi:hypothetical protein
MNKVNCPHQQQNYRFGRGGSDPEHQKHQADISVLLDHHQEIVRQVTLLDNGFSASTVSKNPQVVSHLQAHVMDMKARFAKGRAIRSWDEVYALLFAYRDEIQVKYELLEDGVSSQVTTENPQLVALLQAHAHAVSGFVREGRAISGQAYPISETLSQLLTQ